MDELDICVFLHTKFKNCSGHFDLKFSFLINIHRSGKQVDMAVCLSLFCQEKLEPPYSTHSIPFKGKNINLLFWAGISLNVTRRHIFPD